MIRKNRSRRLKRLLCLAISAICFTMSGICPEVLPVYGNSAPSYWEAFPYSEVLVVEKDSPIVVDREHLTFDFSKADYYDEKRDSRSPVGKVTAEYQMTNPTDDTLTVQMAFPFVASLNNISVADIAVSADGAAVPYEIYIDPNNINTFDQSGNINIFSDAWEDFFYESGAIGHISNQEGTLPGFDLDSEAKLYRFALSSEEKPYLEFEVSFAVDREQALLIGKDFDGSNSFNEGIGTLSTRIREESLSEILVLGNAPEFTYAVRTDEGEKAEKNLYKIDIFSDSVDAKEYLLAAFHKAIGEEAAAVISDTQLLNLCLHEIEQEISMYGYSTLSQVFPAIHSDRIFTLVYQVEFPARSTKTVSVGYLTEGEMDRRETVSPKYSYAYLLSPAKNWADFGSLDIGIITPQEAPYIIESSLPFTNDGENRYRARSEELPDTELTFTLYKKERITLMDQAEKAIGSAGYLFFFFWPVSAIILLLALIPVVRAVIRRKRGN